MKKALLTILVSFLFLLFYQTQICARKADGNTGLTTTRSSDCVSVTLIANSKTLDKENPTVLVVRIENQCRERIRVQEPVYHLEKVLPESEGRSRAWYTGRTLLDKEPYFDNTFKAIEQNDYLEFVLNINEIRWMSSRSSNEVFENTFKILETGDYELSAQIDMDTPNNKKSKEARISSNRLKFRFN